MYFGTKYKDNYYLIGIGYIYIYDETFTKTLWPIPAEPQTNQHQIRLAGRLETCAKTDLLQSVDIFQIFLHNSDSGG